MGRKKNRRFNMNHMEDDKYYHEHAYENEGGKSYKGSYKAKRGWDTGDAPEVCKNCDYLPSNMKQKFRFQHDVWKVMMALCSNVKVEWQALLKGTIDEDGVINITGYIIPQQEVTASNVKNLEVVDDVYITANQIIAGIHSHGNMGVFFSGTDDEHTNMSLIKHNIVVNNRGEYKATSRVELPCGLVKFIEGEVVTVGDPSVVIEGIEKIVHKTFGFIPSDIKEGKWNTTKQDEVEEKTKLGRKVPPGHIGYGSRWCPTCYFKPEEDDGSCKCVTGHVRTLLPDFTVENYMWDYANTYKLRPHLQSKYEIPEDEPPVAHG